MIFSVGMMALLSVLQCWVHVYEVGLIVLRFYIHIFVVNVLISTSLLSAGMSHTSAIAVMGVVGLTAFG